MTLVLILAAALMVLMALVEWANYRRTRRLTFLTAAHGLIAVGYCLPPFLIAFLPGTSWQYGPRGPAFNPWGMRLFALDLADHLALSAGAYVTVGIVLLGAYAAMLVGYAAGRRLDIAPLRPESIPPRALQLAGLALGMLGVIALGIFATQFDSLRLFIVDAVHFRSGTLPVEWGFLQVFAQVTYPAALILFACAMTESGRARIVLAAVAALVFAVAGLRVLHVAGRLEMGGFLLVPVVAGIFMLRSRRLATAGFILAAVAAVAIATVPHDFSHDPAGKMVRILASMADRLPRHAIHVLTEFAFPHIVAAHAVTTVPDAIGFRYFIDIPLGALYMLPNFSGVETLPPMILSLQAKLLPWMPVDLFSFGYYSLGTVGVLIIFAGFGAVLAVFDSWLTGSSGWLGQALRAAWLFYLPFRLFYADPYAAAYSGFGLITATLLIVLLIALSRRRA